MKKLNKNRKQSTKKTSNKKGASLSPELQDALTVLCPRCSAFPGDHCMHTKGKKKGGKCLPHEERIRLAKVKLSSISKDKISKITTEVVEGFKVKKADPHEKLTPEQAEVVKVISDKILTLGRHAEFVGPVTVGPIISTYRFFPVKRTKVAHLEAMNKDFAVALGAESIVVKRMPGESAVGIFVPNKKRLLVTFKSTLQHVSAYMQEDTDDKHKPIPLNFGIDSNGDPAVDDLTMQPHLLIAGTTGSGKSTEQHALVLSMCWTMAPEELQMIISDTKGVEFTKFKALPHLIRPICTDRYKTLEALDFCVKETQDRLDAFGEKGVRNIHEYNKLNPTHQMPYIVFVIDELADLVGPGLEKAEAKAASDKLGIIVARSRASGIHMIVATQRPDVKLIKGNIKANFPTRLCFRLPSHQDSRTVLSTKGAENLMSRGDCFYQSSMHPELRRLHAPLTTLEDTVTVVAGILTRHQEESEIRLREAQPVINPEDAFQTTKPAEFNKSWKN